MALKYGFFDSLNGDRKYSASDFGDLFTGLISEGVYQGVLDEFDVDTIWGGGLATHYVIGMGRAWLDGKWISNDSPVQFEINHSNDTDVDEYIFIVVDNRLAYRQIRFEVLRTLPTNTPSLKYYMIAQTKINLTGSVNITKKVGTSTLPYVSGLISTYSIDQHAANWEAAWNAYIQAKITETDDIVANLETTLTDNWTAWMISLRDELQGDLDVYINGESNRQNQQDANIEILQRQFANYLDRLDSLEQTGIPNAIEYIEPWISDLQRYKQSNDARVDALETAVNNNTVEFGADISELQLKTQNIPVDGSFNPNVQDVTIPSDARVIWMEMPTGTYYVADGITLGYPANYILVHHERRNHVGSYQSIFHTNGMWTRILNTNDASVLWNKFSTSEDVYSFVMRQIPNGGDLNTITTPGFYRLGGSTGAYENAPSPTGNYGYLEHIQQYNDTFALQRFTHANAARATPWIRIRNNSGWTPWLQSITSTDVNNQRAASSITDIKVAATETSDFKVVKDNVTKLACILGRIKITSAVSAGAVLFNLPSGFMPSYIQTMNADVAAGGVGQFGRVVINPNGQVTAGLAIPANYYISFYGVYDVF